MWIFKADITGSFNQLYWDQHTTPLMGFMLDEDTLMLMLTCGFGVGVTPMIWSEVGDAMNRTANLRTLIKKLRLDHHRISMLMTQPSRKRVRHPNTYPTTKAATIVRDHLRGVGTK